MKPQDKLNKAARAHGWANWSEVLMHNAPAHVINLIVEEAMREAYLCDALEVVDKHLVEATERVKDFYQKKTGKEYVDSIEPDLTWRPGARVRIIGNSNNHGFCKGEQARVGSFNNALSLWACWHLDRDDFWYVHESDAVVVG